MTKRLPLNQFHFRRPAEFSKSLGAAGQVKAAAASNLIHAVLFGDDHVVATVKAGLVSTFGSEEDAKLFAAGVIDHHNLTHPNEMADNPFA